MHRAPAYAERGASRRRGVWRQAPHLIKCGGAGLGRVCEAGPLRGKATTRGVQEGQARTATSAKAPFGSIATPRGPLNRALAPSSSSLKPQSSAFMPLPARLVVAPVVLSLNPRRPRISWNSACVMKGKRVIRWPVGCVPSAPRFPSICGRGLQGLAYSDVRQCTTMHDAFGHKAWARYTARLAHARRPRPEETRVAHHRTEAHDNRCRRA